MRFIIMMVLTFAIGCSNISLCPEHKVSKRAGELGECVYSNNSVLEAVK